MHGTKKLKRDKFAMVPLWWAEQASQAMETPQAMLLVWLIHLAWEAQGPTFRLPNSRLRDRGVSRFVKGRALRQLEEAGLIQVAREEGKSPTVTLLYL